MKACSGRNAPAGKIAARARPTAWPTGDNGLLVDPAAPGQLARALATMARDPDLRRRLAARAADLVRTRFSYKAGVERLADRLGYPRASLARPVLARAAE